MIEDWFLSYNDSVNNFLVYFTGSRDVEDMVQETFLRALRGLHSYKGTSTPKVWLLAIARNVAVDFARKKRRTPMLDEIPGNIRADQHSVEEMAVIREETLEVLTLLRSLKASYRDVVVLRCVQGLPACDAAQILGWTQAKVNVTYHRALKQVRDRLSSQVEGAIANDRG